MGIIRWTEKEWRHFMAKRKNLAAEPEPIPEPVKEEPKPMADLTNIQAVDEKERKAVMTLIAAEAAGIIVGRLMRLAIIALGCFGLFTIFAIGYSKANPAEPVKVEKVEKAKAKPVKKAVKKVKIIAKKTVAKPVEPDIREVVAGIEERLTTVEEKLEENNIDYLYQEGI